MPKLSEIKAKLFQLAEDISPVITFRDIKKYKPELALDSCITTLQRMRKQGEAVLPWKGVYIIAPNKYFGECEIHVREYIDVIMRNSGREYYVALQDAISAQILSYKKTRTTFQVIIDGKGLPSSNGNTFPALSFSYSKSIPYKYIYSKETKYGKINIASAELTAIDFVTYVDAIGGLQASVEALKVLSPKLNFRRLKDDIFEYRTAANVQRLGYIIENVLCMPAKAMPLHDLLDKRYNKVYARNSLASSMPATHNIDKRWQLDINIELCDNMS